jgi:hypothetical protein
LVIDVVVNIESDISSSTKSGNNVAAGNIVVSNDCDDDTANGKPAKVCRKIGLETAQDFSPTVFVSKPEYGFIVSDNTEPNGINSESEAVTSRQKQNNIIKTKEIRNKYALFAVAEKTIWRRCDLPNASFLPENEPRITPCKFGKRRGGVIRNLCYFAFEVS